MSEHLEHELAGLASRLEALEARANGTTRATQSMTEQDIRLLRAEVGALRLSVAGLQREMSGALDALDYLTPAVEALCFDPDGEAVDYDTVALATEDLRKRA